MDMRAFKKSLAVLLALSLALGLAPAVVASVSTDEAGYSDEDDIKNKEAVEVLSALRIMEGNPDGSFAPKRSVTRSEAAAIIARMMLTRDTADNLTVTTPPFSDVASSHWANRYISYCVARGIVVGRPDGTFAPNAPVTAVEFAIMVMRALGIGDPDRWVGQAWKIFAMLDGINNGILTSESNFENDASREDTALYTLNGMMRGKMEERKSTWFLVMATEVAAGRPGGIIGNEYHSVAAANQAALEDNEGAVNGINYTLAPFQKTEEVSVGSIAYVVHGLSWEIRADLFGRPGQRIWTKSDSTVAVTMTSEPVRTYTVAVTEATLYRDLSLTANVTDAVRFNNGIRTENVNIRRSNSTTILGSGRGTVTEVYLIDDKYTIVVVDTWLGEVERVETGSFASRDSVFIIPTTVKPTASFVVGAIATTGFAVGDMVLYTATSSDNGATFVVRSISLATEETVTPLSWSTTSFRAGGKTYNYSKNFIRVVSNSNPHIIWLDDFGYVLDVDAPPAIPNYAYVIRSVEYSNEGDDWTATETIRKAELLLKDGKTVTVNLSAAYVIDDNDTTDPRRLVTYTISSSRYTLTAASAPADMVAIPQNGSLTIIRNNPRVDWQHRFAADVSTVYMVRSGSEDSCTYEAHTDFREVPSMGGLGSSPVSGIVLHTANMARVVYIENPRLGSGPDQVFVSSSSAEQVTMPNVTFWLAKHVLFNGAPPQEEMHLAENYPVGLYQWVSTDNRGVTRLEDPVAGQTEAISYSNGIIAIHGGDFQGAYVPGADINVFLYNPDNGAIERSGVSSLPSEAEGAVRTFFVTLGAGENAHRVTNLFVEDLSIE